MKMNNLTEGRPKVAAMLSPKLRRAKEVLMIVLLCCLGWGARGQCAISGTTTVCVGVSTTLAISGCGTGGCSWVSTDPAIASIDCSTGILTGVAAGTVPISYSGTGGTAYATVTVLPQPAPGPITGTSTICIGSSSVLGPTGGSWTSSATSIATVNTTTGRVYGVTAGSATITNTVTNSCGTASATLPVIVETPFATPTLTSSTGSSIAGINNYCFGTSFTLSSSITGGAWSTTNSFLASVSPGGTVTTVGGGSHTGPVDIRYTITNSCGTVSEVMHIYMRPSATASIVGKQYICPGETISFSHPAAVSGSCSTCWTSSSPGVATVALTSSTTADVTTIAAGTTTISHTSTDMCAVTYTQVYTVHVGTPTSLSVTSPICAGTNTTASLSAYPYYSSNWSSSASTRATVSTGGTVTGVSGGTATISYTCGGSVVTAPITVNVTPTVSDIFYGAIMSGITLCTGNTITLTDATPGGTWSSGNPVRATIDATGNVTGLTAGYVTISYAVSSGICTTVKTNTITVFTSPSGGIISGPSFVCTGHTIALNTTGATPSGGSWSSSGSSIATVDAISGVVYGITPGTATITFTTPTTAYCGSAYSTYTVTVNPPPPAITGTTSFCQSSGTILSHVAGTGTWSSSDISVASIDPTTGVVTSSITGSVPRTATIYYGLPTACGYAVVSTTITVYPNPVITGPFAICEGLTTTIGATIAGGTWSSSSPAVATIHPGTGFLTALSPGTTLLNYVVPTAATGCGTAATFTVNPNPVITVGVGAAAATTLPAVDCGSGVLLTGHSTEPSTTFTWAPTTSTTLFFPGTSTLVAGLPAPVVLSYGITGPTTYFVTGVTAAGCMGTTTYTVVQPTCDYSFCQAFSGAPIYALAGTIGTAGSTTIMPAGNYNVQANVTFQGNVQFTNNVLAITPGVSISVSPTAQLDVTGSHLYCCDVNGLWTGIILQSGLTSSGRMTIGGNSLVEDARTAVSIANGFIPASGNVFTSDGTVFNKNKLSSIDISVFPNPASSFIPATYPYTYPFLIRNTVFTSRNLSVIAPTGSGPTHAWPMVWPAATGTANGLKTAYTPTTTYPAFTPPFNIVNPSGSGVAGVRYPYSACNDGTPANMGIKLLNVGDYHSTGLNQTATYAGIEIGDNTYVPDNTGQNLFDTLLEGIYARNSDFTCYNNAFLYMHAPPPSYPVGNLTGDGIGAQGAATAVTGTTVYPKYGMTVTGSTSPTAPTRNVFYDNVRGINGIYYYNVDCHNSFIINYPSTTATTSGATGINVNTPRYHDVNVTGNTVTNHLNGIVMVANLIGGDINQFAGNLSIRNNAVQSNAGGGTPTGGMAVLNGIAVTNNAFTTTPANTYWLGTAHVDANSMYSVYNGILVNGFHIGQTITSDSNYVRVNNRASSSSAQYGIWHVNCNASQIFLNNITGPGWNVPAATSTTAVASKISGIYGAANTNTTVSCNYTGQINIGFQFIGTGNIHQWMNNEMDENTYGMVMKGDFGPQGNATTASNNVWKNTSGTWWTPPNYNIFTLNTFSPMALSPIFLKSNATGSTDPYIYDPLNNYGRPFFTITDYYGFGAGAGNGLNIIGANPELPECLTLPPMAFAKPVKLATGPYDEGMAQNWIGQNALLQMIQQDDTYTDGEPALQDFAAKAANSRYGWLSNIAGAIMRGDKATATALLAEDIHAHVNTTTDPMSGVVMQDGEDADYIVSNYITIYNAGLKYLDTTLTGDDSEQVKTIAGLCPYTNGPVVYMAQAMYRTLYNDYATQFEGNCEELGNKASPSDNRQSKENAYSLFPNPNNGSFEIIQSINNDNVVHIRIQDALGRQIYEQSSTFNNQTLHLQPGKLAPGMYLLRITDVDGKASNFKFVVQ